jgi:hypothetical protein
MKAPPPLRVELGSSRVAAALICIAYLATSLLLATMPGDAILRGFAVAAIGAHALWLLRTWAWRAMPWSIVALELGADLRLAITERSGRRIEAAVRPESYVSAWLTTIVLRPDGARLSRAMTILPDMLPPDDFRRLRVLLRLGERAG